MQTLRRAPVTAILLLLIGIVFVLELLSGGSTNPYTLLRLGANSGQLIAQGEYWRLVASMFLHIGFIHLLVNGWALYQLGTLFEVWLGSARLLLVYFAAGIAGSLASAFLSSANLSAGASGAIFGVMGALIAFLLRRRRALNQAGRSILSQLAMWAGINVFLGFSMPGIDNYAHLGGCAAGFLLGLTFRERPAYAPQPQIEVQSSQPPSSSW
jgi:rhomboid protease GluP